MPQRLALYAELTVAENLRFRADVYGLGDPRAAVEAAIEDFELGPYRRRRAANLSGGWARRLQLAAALIHRPGLVLLAAALSGCRWLSAADMWRYRPIFFFPYQWIIADSVRNRRSPRRGPCLAEIPRPCRAARPAQRRRPHDGHSAPLHRQPARRPRLGGLAQHRPRSGRVASGTR